MPGLYSIPLAGLKEARYTYEFSLGDDFFEAFEGSELKRGELTADVVLQKCSAHYELDININGQVGVICDRCLEEFFMPLSVAGRLIVRQGRVWDDSDPDMVTISPEEHELDLSQFFYEYIHLALPIKRIHPDDSDGHTTCDPEMIRKLQEHTAHGEKEHDPRWDELERLSTNN